MARATLKINLRQVLDNAKYHLWLAQKNLPKASNKTAPHPIKLMAVLKANGYGLGAIPIGKKLASNGITDFGFATGEECQQFHNHLKNVELYLLGNPLTETEEIKMLINARVIIGFSSKSMLKSILVHAKQINKIARVQWLVDTGMGRLGAPFATLIEESTAIFDFLKKHSNWLHLECVYSHFSNADAKNDLHTKEQIKKFGQVRSLCEKKYRQLKDFSKKSDGELPNSNKKNHSIASPSNMNHYKNSHLRFHLSNSFGVQNYSHSQISKLIPDHSDLISSQELIRIGIGLYGVSSDRKISHQLSCPYTLTSKIIDIRELPKGHPIGYNLTYKLNKKSRIITMGAGYADGLPVFLGSLPEICGPTHHSAYVDGLPARVIGKVSMDYTTLLISPKASVKRGDDVLLLGDIESSHSHLPLNEDKKIGPTSQTLSSLNERKILAPNRNQTSHKNRPLTVKNWAKVRGTNEYECFTSLGERVKRVYVD